MCSARAGTQDAFTRSNQLMEGRTRVRTFSRDQLGDVVYLHDCTLAVLSEDRAAKPELHRTPWYWRTTRIVIRIPLQADLRARERFAPVRFLRVELRDEARRNGGRKAALEKLALDPHGQHRFLPLFLAPARAEHHPQEFGLIQLMRENENSPPKRWCSTAWRAMAGRYA